MGSQQAGVLTATSALCAPKPVSENGCGTMYYLLMFALMSYSVVNKAATALLPLSTIYLCLSGLSGMKSRAEEGGEVPSLSILI